MKTIDFHCDTLMRLYDLSKDPDSRETLWENRGQIDVSRLLSAGYAAQFFACYLWLEGESLRDSFYEDALAMADLLHNEIRLHPDRIAFAGNYDDYIKNQNHHLLSAFLTVEEGGILEGDLKRLDALYEKGVRLITLTWNYENCIGFPNSRPEYQNLGLKPFGLDVIARMDELGMIIDVSHLSDGGFADVCHYGKRPFLASHSNSRSILNHPRNLTDSMIRQIAEHSGLIGLNFGGEFLQENGESTVEAMVHHIRHIQNIGGKEILAIGTDFDGVEGKMEISGCQDMPRFVRELECFGLHTTEIEGICYENAEKFLKRYWESN